MKQNLPLVSKQSLPQPEIHSVQSVCRALDLLDAFPPIRHRLLAILEVRGYVERTADRRRHRLGKRAFELGAGVYFNVYCCRWS